MLCSPHFLDKIAHADCSDPGGNSMGQLSFRKPVVNSFCDAIWRYWYRSTLAQVFAWCLTEPSHYLNQCWYLFCEVLWHSHESSFNVSAQTTILWNEFENHSFKIIATSPKVQRVTWVSGVENWHHSSAHFYWHGLTWIQACPVKCSLKLLIHSQMLYPIAEWISTLIPHFITDVIAYLCLD